MPACNKQFGAMAGFSRPKFCLTLQALALVRAVVSRHLRLPRCTQADDSVARQ